MSKPEPMELVHQQTGSVDVRRDDPFAQVTDMLRMALKGGITQENVGVAKDLMTLFKDMAALDAEKRFNAAFVAMKAELPKIEATSAVMNKEERGGGVRFRFAALEEISVQVDPILSKHGFFYTFSDGDAEAGKICKVVTLGHDSGHSRTAKAARRIGKGPPGCSETQADGAAASYAKRDALCDVLGIIISKQFTDNDASMEGDVISSHEAACLRQRVADTKTDEFRFLQLAQVAISDSATEDDVRQAYAKIRTSHLPILNDILKAKEARKK